MDVAAAAIKMLESRDETDEADIPTVAPRPERTSRDDDRRPSFRERERSGERGADRARPSRGDTRTDGRPERKVAGKPAAKSGAKARATPEWTVARLWVGAGRKAKMRPGDLVGAIANEVGIDAGSIGAIQITDAYSTVEVPEEIADDIVAALKATKIKGMKVPVRRDRTK